MKKRLVSQSGFFNRRVLIGLFFCLTGVFLALVGFGKNEGPGSSNPGNAGHVTWAGSSLPAIAEHPIEPQDGADRMVLAAPATRGTVMAKWNRVAGALGYRLDVSTSSSFSSYVSDYQDLDVGNVMGRVVTGLSRGTTYYYRVRAYSATGAMSNSDIMSATTITAPGLVINPTFESSILNDPNAAAIQAVINQAISILESLFSDPITVPILYRYTTVADPCQNIPPGALAVSCTSTYNEPWNVYVNALIADATTANDNAANATLPGTPLSTNLVIRAANGRAIGLDTPGTTFLNGSGPYDATITINPNQPFQFTRPPSADRYDLQRSVEHEMDEVLGLGSGINRGANLGPQDLFSWSSPGVRNFTSSGTRYFSINSGNTNIVPFNQDPGGDFGDWDGGPCPNQVNPYVQNAFSCAGQVDDVTATSPEGINLDVIGYNLGTSNATPTPTPTPPPGSTALGNISTRLRVETGDNVLIGGFIVTGTQPKRVIVRAIGPSLPFGGTLPDPTLSLYDGNGTLIAFNDDWRSNQEAEIIATGIPPTNDLESAMVVTLPANNSGYTAIVAGFNNGTGIGVVEAYDLDRTVDSKLANISTRGFVSTGDNVMIAGTIIVGSNSAGVFLRALGPSLSGFVANAMQDPTLELRDANGTLIAFNDDWRSDQEAAIIATGIPPTNDLESAIVVTLPANNAAYTAIVRGYQNSEGVALVEAYQLQ
jgi:hypothetical protein